jgi:hypothetical protein
MNAVPEGDRRVTIELGNFEISNGDGELDAVVRGYSVDGRRIRVLLGLQADRYDRFTPIFTGRMVQWANDLKDVGVVARDETYRLDRTMQADLYGGTGGYDGGADLAGKPRPLTFGRALNVTPAPIDAANLVFQFHSRQAQAVDAVYDRGAALAATADYASFAALTAATLTTGQFATCLALGLIRLGSTASGLVTADVKGDAAGSYVDTTALIARRIMQDFGLVGDSEIDLASVSDFGTAFPGTIGWYQPPATVKLSDALNQIVGHCGGWWGALPSGQFQFGFLSLPSADRYVLDIDAADMVADLVFLQPLAGTFPPRFRQRVGYQQLFTTQSDQDLAGSVTAARRQYLSQDFRVASVIDASVQSDYLLATDPAPLQSLFYSQADAAALAASLLALYKVARQTVRVILDLKGLGARLGASVLVTHPRLNGGEPIPMLVMDITIRADDRLVELVLWG